MSSFDRNPGCEVQFGRCDDRYSTVDLGDSFAGDDDDDFVEDQELRQNYKAALQWLRRGYNVVPQKARDKKYPGVEWRELQTRTVTKDDLLDWYSKFANGVGFITGKISGVIVIETDGPEGEALLEEFESKHGALPTTLSIRSGSGRGVHRHFRHPGYRVKTKANPSIKVDVKGDGGFCVLPPSRHRSGGRYEVVLDADPADLPEGLLEFIQQSGKAAGGEPESKNKNADAKAQPRALALPEDWGSNTSLSKPTLPPPQESSARAMLKHLVDQGYFEPYDAWIKAGMGLKQAYGEEIGFDLWAITHRDDDARASAAAHRQSFAADARSGDVTIGTLIKAAKVTGFLFPQSRLVVPAAPVGLNQSQEVFGDVKNGRLFAAMFRGKLLHVHEANNWLSFDPEMGWLAALPGEADRAAKEVLEMMRRHFANLYVAAPEDPNTKRLMTHIRRSCQAQRVHAMIDMAESEPGMTRSVGEFDTDAMLLGVRNGVLDLQKRALLPVSPDLLVTKRCNIDYDPSAACPRFEQFIAEVQPDPNVRGLLQRWIGYCLTGLTWEQKFVFLYGHGANGKSVFIELIAWLLGDYAHKMVTELLLPQQRNSAGPSPDVVALKGVRYAHANETQEGRRLDESRVKELTGGDTLTGRVPYAKAAISFQPACKLNIAGNHKPTITDVSVGMWRRVILILFCVTIPEDQRDQKLSERLKAEGPGILNWALKGLKDWQLSGLQVPKSVEQATAAYRDEQDILGEWVADRCTTGRGCSGRKGELYKDYVDWAKLNGHQPLSQTRMTRRLTEGGFKLSKDRRKLHGLALKRGPAQGDFP